MRVLGTIRLRTSFISEMPGQERQGWKRSLLLGRRAVAALVLVSAVGCGEAPLESIGLRSSEWINDPTVPTTIAVNTTTPTIVAMERLEWANDAIATANLSDRDALLAEVFARRQGDRFIQASRAEIVVALPDVAFPSTAPAGAEWVSSQLVFDNDGTIASDPSAAFGIWSAEPYTRSRSVAQMVVMRVSNDLDTATELATGELAVSCALFSDRATDTCEIINVASRDAWLLGDSGGTTLVWFEGPYRYELFGRSFVPDNVLIRMSESMMPLGSLGAESS
jgi:hypothetical protein